MKIPKKVKIGAHIYKIDFDSDPTNDDDSCFGCVSNRKLKIGIDSTVSLTQQEETFFHEVLHAIVYLNGISEGKDDDEKKVQAIAHSFYLFLKENNLLK